MTSTVTPIGIMLPIRSGNVGYFDQSTDSLTAYKMNIINLIRTKPGKRRLNPTFGCHLWDYVFEQMDDFLPDKIEKTIRSDINKWIPGVMVNSVSVKYFQDDQNVNLIDNYKLYIVVNFVVTSINQEDSVGIILNGGKV